MLLVINDELRRPNFLLLANCVSLSLPAKFSTTQLLTLFRSPVLSTFSYK